jgi:hypothetical protein
MPTQQVLSALQKCWQKSVPRTFLVGEIIFLFTNEKHLDDDDPFHILNRPESLDNHLSPPEDDPHGMWELRENLLCLQVCDKDLDV